MKEKILYHGIPIVGRMPLFTAENRQAIRDDRKRQTRRLNGLEEINEDPGTWQFTGFRNNEAVFTIPGFATRRIKLPWVIGDVRCMCESLMRGATTEAAYYRDDWKLHQMATPVISIVTGKPIPWRWKREHLASIHMPTEAARTVCKITDIRVEQLQKISEEDAKAEGVRSIMDMTDGMTHEGLPKFAELFWPPFRDLWDSINAKRGYGWDVPQMVWVVGFKKLEV